MVQNLRQSCKKQQLECTNPNIKAKSANHLDKYHCYMFDFLCYKSIVLYINHHHQHADKIFNFNEEIYWDFSKIATQSRHYG